MLLVLLLATVVLANVQGPAYQGVWWWTWTSGLSGLNRGATNIAIAFSGWTDPTTAIQSSAGIVNQLPGTKFISLGGGNANGRWGTADVPKVTNACRNRQFSGYNGIAFDIEEGDNGLDFRGCFKACKDAGYQVMVTVSHSAPYGVGDAARLMRSFFSDSNIDFLSPQMYTTGNEGGNDFTVTAGVQWSEYASSRAKIVPAIVTGNFYNDVQSKFKSYGVTTQGYVQWSQTMTYPSGGNPPTGGNHPTGGGTIPCGAGTCPSNQCCSQYNYCGVGDTYCGAGCKAGQCSGNKPKPNPKPTPKPDPKPAASSSSGTFCQNSGKVCDPGFCCSKWGWCGQGAGFCTAARLTEGESDNNATVTGNQDGGALSTGALIAIVVCSVLVAVIIVGLALFVLTRKADSESERF